jgi:hypothetical protein
LLWTGNYKQYYERMRASLVKAIRVACGPQRRVVVASAVGLFLLFFLLRGGVTPSSPSTNWPWPVGTVHTGQTDEPYLFIVMTPRYLLTFEPYTMLRWAAMALLFGWALAMLREAAARQACTTPGARAGVGLLGGILGLAGAGACCGSLVPAALALGGLGVYAGALDGLSAALWSALILWQGDRLARNESCVTGR